jgi:hypothetical protein
MNINGNFNLSLMNSLDGKQQLGNIKCKTLSTNLISNAELNALDGIDTTKTIQSQINTINSTLSNSINGGGFFMLYAESPSISTIINSGYNWQFGGANNSNKGVTVGCNCFINHISIVTSAYPTNNTTVKIMKSSDNSTYTDTGLSISLSTSQTYNNNTNLNYSIDKGTILNFQTTAGSGSVICRISITFSSAGVKGDAGVTPNFSIGAVNSLPFGSTPSVTITGTQTNPVLNFNLISGPENQFINENMQGIYFNSSTDTTTIDNNLIVSKTFVNRGDGNSIYATSNIATTKDIYMNCYSNEWNGTRTYNYYNLYDFITAENTVTRNRIDFVGTVANNSVQIGSHAQDTANDAYNIANDAYNRANNAQNRANDAYQKASDAEAIGSSALGLTGTNSLAIGGLASALAGTNATVLAHTGQLLAIDTNLSALNGKTSKMNPASATASNFLDAVKVYTSLNQITPVITIDPNTISSFNNGLEVAETLTANEISCDKVGCNELNLSGNLNLPTSDATIKSVTTSGSAIQNLDGSAIYIGHLGTPVYIGGLLYNPIANFFSQW